VAGWRRERLASLPDEALEVVPDWICEVLSPSNYQDTYVVKRSFYARLGVKHLWYVDYRERIVTVLELDHNQGRWVELGVYGGQEVVRAAPFDAVELDIAAWW